MDFNRITTQQLSANNISTQEPIALTDSSTLDNNHKKVTFAQKTTKFSGKEYIELANRTTDTLVMQKSVQKTSTTTAIGATRRLSTHNITAIEDTRILTDTTAEHEDIEQNNATITVVRDRKYAKIQMVLTGGILTVIFAIFLGLSTIDVGFNKVYHIIFITLCVTTFILAAVFWCCIGCSWQVWNDLTKRKTTNNS